MITLEYDTPTGALEVWIGDNSVSLHHFDEDGEIDSVIMNPERFEDIARSFLAHISKNEK